VLYLRCLRRVLVGEGEGNVIEAKAKPAAPRDLMQELRRSIEVIS
jgi:hypothetical protein